MSKRKKINTETISTPDAPMYGRYQRAVDISSQEWARRVTESRNPTFLYWSTTIPLALISTIIGGLQMVTQAITVKGIGFLITGIVLTILIIAKLVRR